jgi:hypothetical protein
MADPDFLSSLPEEIVDKICAYLNRPDVVSVRMTCNSLKGKSYRQFGLAYFSTVQITLTPDSLQDLVKIYSHARFGRCVKKLEISRWAFPTRSYQHIKFPAGDPRDKPEDPVVWQKVKRDQRRRYHKLFHQQCRLRKHGLDHAALVLALQRLPALHSIALVTAIDLENPPRAFNSIRRATGIFPDVSTLPNQNLPYYYNSHRGVYRWNWIKEAAEMKTMALHSVYLVLGTIAHSGIQLKGTLDLDSHPTQFPLEWPHPPKTHTSRRTIVTPAEVFAKEDYPALRKALEKLHEPPHHYPIALYRDTMFPVYARKIPSAW